MARTVQDITVQPSTDKPGHVMVRLDFGREREWVKIPGDMAFRAGLKLMQAGHDLEVRS